MRDRKDLALIYPALFGLTYVIDVVNRMGRSLCGLEELNYVAGRVFAKNLAASWSLQNVVFEFYTIILELGDDRFQIVEIQNDPVPATSWSGDCAI